MLIEESGLHQQTAELEPAKIQFTVTFDALELHTILSYINSEYLGYGYDIKHGSDIAVELNLYLKTGVYTAALTKTIEQYKKNKLTLYKNDV